MVNHDLKYGKPYKLKVGHRSSSSDELAHGTLCYLGRGYDYGLSSDDTRATGIEHVSMTLNVDGSYPTFTVPICDLEAVPTVKG